MGINRLAVEKTRRESGKFWPLEGAHPGQLFAERVRKQKILPLVGVHDVFSAAIAIEQVGFEGVFASGFSITASRFAGPDVGKITAHDVREFAGLVRDRLKSAHLLSDIDGGFGSGELAAQLVRDLEVRGVSAVIMDDQDGHKCGHAEGKQVLTPEHYLEKLATVLANRQYLQVIARTDALCPEEGIRRAALYAEQGADAVMVEAIKDLSTLEKLASVVSVPIMVNQLHGGKSKNWSLDELQRAGASIVIYSTPTLFAAQDAITNYLMRLKKEQVLPSDGTATMAECNALLSLGVETL